MSYFQTNWIQFLFFVGRYYIMFNNVIPIIVLEYKTWMRNYLNHYTLFLRKSNISECFHGIRFWPNRDDNIKVTSPHLMIIWKTGTSYFKRTDHVQIGDVMKVRDILMYVTNIERYTIRLTLRILVLDLFQRFI